MHAFTDMSRGNFAPVLLASLIDTAVKPWKFDRFAKQVLGSRLSRRPSRELQAARWSATIKAHARQRPEQSAAQALSGARGLRPHRRAGPHRQHRVRRSSRRRLTTRRATRRSAIRTCGTSGSSTGCSTTARSSQPLARNIGEALGVGAIAPLRSDMREPLPPRASDSAAPWTSPACNASNTRCSCCVRRAGPRKSLGAIDPAKADARRANCSNSIAGSATARTSPERRAPAGQRAAQAVDRTGVAHRSDPAGPHRHGSRLPRKGFMERRYDLSATGLEQRRPAGRAAAAADPRAAARRALPAARSGPPAHRSRGAARRSAGGARGLSRSRRAARMPQIPADAFAAIDTALAATADRRCRKCPMLHAPPPDPLGCAIELPP